MMWTRTEPGPSRVGRVAHQGSVAGSDHVAEQTVHEPPGFLGAVPLAAPRLPPKQTDHRTGGQDLYPGASCAPAAPLRLEAPRTNVLYPVGLPQATPAPARCPGRSAAPAPRDRGRPARL